MRTLTLLVAASFLTAISALALSPVNEEAHDKAKRELKQRGSGPLLDSLNRAKGKGPLGRAEGNVKIVGGTDGIISDYPWQVSIVRAASTSNLTGHFCGGSLIKPGWVLTAAHCVDHETSSNQISVVTGTSDLGSGGERTSVKRIIIHRAYDIGTNNNDIALLELARPVAISPVRSPVQLINPHHEASALKGNVTITGWGYKKENGKVSPILQTADVPMVDRETCNAPDAYDGHITDNMICAGRKDKDSCQGDSGGPLVVKRSERVYALVGVVSWGEGCARENKPGVYTRVANYVDWVNAQIP